MSSPPETVGHWPVAKVPKVSAASMSAADVSGVRERQKSIGSIHSFPLRWCLASIINSMAQDCTLDGRPLIIGTL